MTTIMTTIPQENKTGNIIQDTYEGTFECRTCGKIVHSLKRAYRHIALSYGLILTKAIEAQFIDEKKGVFQ